MKIDVEVLLVTDTVCFNRSLGERRRENGSNHKEAGAHRVLAVREMSQVPMT